MMPDSWGQEGDNLTTGLADFGVVRITFADVPTPHDHGRSVPASSADPLTVRFFAAGLAAAELMTCYLGLRLGLYEALRALGPATAAAVADRSGIDPRYAREWLEQQAAAGILRVKRDSTDPDQRLFEVPEAAVRALLDPDNPNWIAPLVVMPIGGVGSVLPQLEHAYRTGTGIAYDAYGSQLRGGGFGLNNAIFKHELAGWIATALPDINARLRVPGARVADIGCGSGQSSIALAEAYPEASVHGLDLDPRSIQDAIQNAELAGLGTDRLRFEVRDAAAAELLGKYDLVCIFDALHDMSRPVETLRTCRGLLAERGSVLLMEPRVGERFVAPTTDIERFHFAVSVLHCLPVGLYDQPSAGTGTVMRPATVSEYAEQAGLTMRVLDVEHPFHRLYRLQPRRQ